MPIEIRELIIKAIVSNNQNDQNAASTKEVGKALKDIESAYEKNNLRLAREIKLRESKINDLQTKLKNQVDGLIKLVEEICKS